MGRPVRPAKPVGHNLPLSGAALGMASSRIPGAKQVAKIARAFPSAQAVHRHDVLRWHAEHESRVRLTARHFGLSPDTVSRWARAYAELGTRGLEDRSRRPQRLRQPTTPTAVVVRIRELRERYPRWVRVKLRVLLLREGLDVSAKTIDRTINRLRARGDLKEPVSARKALRARARAALRPRRPGDLVVDRPGFLQSDSPELRLGAHRLTCGPAHPRLLSANRAPVQSGVTSSDARPRDVMTQHNAIDRLPPLRHTSRSALFRAVMAPSG